MWKGVRLARIVGSRNVVKEMKMSFTPVGRYLLIEPIEIKEKKKKGAQVLVPDSYASQNIPRFKMCRVVKVGTECTPHISANTLAVVDNTMVEKIEVLENTFFIILESHVVGMVER